MTLSHTLQSSLNQDQDQRPQSLFSLHLNDSLSLSLISISYLSLLVSDTNSTLKSQTFSLSLFVSLSISDKYSNQKPEISSPNPQVSHKRSLSLTL